MGRVDPRRSIRAGDRVTARKRPAVERRRATALTYHRNLCYAAEAEARRAAKPPTLTPREARTLFDAVVADLGCEPITLRFYTGNRGAGWAYSKQRIVSLSRSGLSGDIVLHEIAHVISADRGHGPAFQRDYLNLCRQWMPGYARSLAAAFKRLGLPVDGTTTTV